MKFSVKKGGGILEVVLFATSLMKHILIILEIIKWLNYVMYKYEIQFTSYNTYILILYKCFHLIFKIKKE